MFLVSIGTRACMIWWMPALGMCTVTLLLFRQFGIGWDDPLQAHYGDLLLAYFSSGGQDRRFETFMDLRYYGGAFELVTQFAAAHSPWTVFETRRLVGGLAGAVGVLGCGKLGLFLGDRGTAWLSGLLLATWPAWFGHSFVNSKDVPFASAYVWAIYFLARIAANEEAKWPDHLGFGFWAGLAMAVRSAGLFLLVLYAGTLLMNWFAGWAGRNSDFRSGLLGALQVLCAAGLAWSLMVAAWPWAYRAPLARPLESALLMARFPRPLDVLYDGRVISSGALPWDYIPTLLVLTSPPLMVVLLPISVAIAIHRMARGPAGLASHCLVALSVGVPVLMAIIGRAVLYDGLRQFLFTLPLLSVAAALTGGGLFRRVRRPGPRLLATAVAIGLSVDPIRGLIRLHPYQYTFFNVFSGGMAWSGTRFETDYWGLALREGAEWVREHKEQLKPHGRLRVFVDSNCANPVSAEHYFSASIRLADEEESADLVIAPTRFGCDRHTAGRVVFQVERQGAVLAVVKDRRPAPQTP